MRSIFIESALQLTVECNLGFRLILPFFPVWLVSKIRIPFFNNHWEAKPNQLWLTRTRSPSLDADYMYLLRVLIGWLRCLPLLFLARVITQGLLLHDATQKEPISPDVWRWKPPAILFSLRFWYLRLSYLEISYNLAMYCRVTFFICE